MKCTFFSQAHSNYRIENHRLAWEIIYTETRELRGCYSKLGKKQEVELTITVGEK